jgi:hypothetical protein
MGKREWWRSRKSRRWRRKEGVDEEKIMEQKEQKERKEEDEEKMK